MEFCDTADFKSALLWADRTPSAKQVRLRRFARWRNESVPGATAFLGGVCKAGAGGWIGDINDVVAGRAFDLASGELWVAFQMLFTVGALEFELVCRHSIPSRKS